MSHVAFKPRTPDPSPRRVNEGTDVVGDSGRSSLAARNAAVESHMGLVKSIARLYAGCGLPFEDLVQEGSIGLIRAVERYDPTRGTSFSTYAVWLIRGCMLGALSTATSIRLPVKLHQQSLMVDRAVGDLAGSRGAPVTDEEIIRITGLAESTVRRIREAARVTASLDAPVGGSDACLGDLVGKDHGTDPSEILGEQEEIDDVLHLLRLLPLRHRHILECHLGLGDRDPEPYGRIGERLGVGEDQTRMLEREALRRLRSMIGGRRNACGST